MKIFLTTCLYLSYLVTLPAQSKADYTWILGYPTLIPGVPNIETQGGVFLHFSKETVAVEKFDIFAGPASAVANDNAGNLQFYTTGCGVYSHNMELMENGDGINVGGKIYADNCLKYNDYLLVRSGTLILPQPGSDDKYFQFHLRYEANYDPAFPTGHREIYDEFYHTDVDMSANGGLGKVTAKNQVVVADSLHDAVCAVRHGNGRDWWVIIPRGKGRQFWKILVNPAGIQTPVLDSYPPYAPFDVHYTDGNGNQHKLFEYEFESGTSQAIFSPDGTKYCRIIKAEEVEIYDFDRCTGTMKLLRSIPYPGYYRSVPIFAIGACGLAVSPNNRYLYFNNNETLYQFDMCDERITQGDFEVIADYDGGGDDGIPTNFFQMRNGPDGKIYMGGTSTVRSLHVIKTPDLPGTACNFVQQGLKLPRFTSWLINYFPNFRLYDAAGSPCDTLGIDSPEGPPVSYDFEEFRLFPNPANEEAILYLPECDGARIVIWNVTGQLMRDVPYINGKEAYRVDISDWASGVYVFAVYIDKNKPTMRRLVVTH